MKNQLQQFSSYIKKLNTNLKVSIVTNENVADIEKQIGEYEEDLKKLHATLIEANKYIDQEHMTHTFAHLYLYLGNAIEDLENIHEVITEINQKYAAKFLKDYD